jgi:hypothetical protein
MGLFNPLIKLINLENASCNIIHSKRIKMHIGKISKISTGKLPYDFKIYSSRVRFNIRFKVGKKSIPSLIRKVKEILDKVPERETPVWDRIDSDSEIFAKNQA